MLNNMVFGLLKIGRAYAPTLYFVAFSRLLRFAKLDISGYKIS